MRYTWDKEFVLIEAPGDINDPALLHIVSQMNDTGPKGLFIYFEL